MALCSPGFDMGVRMTAWPTRCMHGLRTPACMYVCTERSVLASGALQCSVMVAVHGGIVFGIGEAIVAPHDGLLWWLPLQQCGHGHTLASLVISFCTNHLM